MEGNDPGLLVHQVVLSDRSFAAHQAGILSSEKTDVVDRGIYCTETPIRGIVSQGKTARGGGGNGDTQDTFGTYLISPP